MCSKGDTQIKYIISIIVFSLSCPVWAGYVNNKTDWDKMPYAQKLGYAQGAFDEHTMATTYDNNMMRDLKEHRLDCLVNMGMTSVGIVELIDNMYSNDVGIWQFPPNIAMIQGLHKMCGKP